MAESVLHEPYTGRTPNGHPRRAKVMTQLIELQNQAWKCAVDEETPIKDRSALMRAWCDLQEERRKLQMRPLPKSIDVSKLGKGKRKAQSGPAYQEPEQKQAPEPAKPVAPTLQPKPDPS